MEPDSLQAARDTVVIVQAQSTSWLEWVSLSVSVLIAGFTGGYLWYTMGIFEKTEEQAKAAKESAEASQEAAEASQASLQQQKRLNDAQIEAIEQERIERAHPLIWVNIEMTEKDDEDWIELEFKNSSSLPAVDVEAVILAEYGPDYISRDEFNNAVQIDMGSPDESKFNLVTAVRKEVITAEASSTFRLKYPVLPVSLPIILQYRDIHGQNYGRHFRMSAMIDTSKLDERSPTPEAVLGYSISKISPKKVKNTPRLFLIDSSSLQERDKNTFRFKMVREEDKRGISVDNPITIWNDLEDKPFLSEVGYLNSNLRYAYRTGLFPYSFKIKETGEGMTPFNILSETTY